MKKLILLPILFCGLILNAQPKSIELLELIKLFVPDSSGSANPDLLESYSNRQHLVNILINGNPVIPDEMLFLDKIDWMESLNPEKTIYSLQAIGFQFAKDAEIILALFGNAEVKSELLKHCIDKNNKDNMTHIVMLNIAGKKPAWMKVETSASYGPYMPVLNLVFYLNENDVSLTCAY
ncbi:MAG: hypothetical protein IT242_02725 [Bacteroidia bacterium]|nr:hypothetical protein [Bacteroidia bacterium]